MRDREQAFARFVAAAESFGQSQLLKTYEMEGFRLPGMPIDLFPYNL